MNNIFKDDLKLLDLFGFTGAMLFSLSGNMPIASSLIWLYNNRDRNLDKFSLSRNSKESQIKIIYGQIIREYVNLQSKLGVKSPAQIFAMFEYALKNGYLSFDKYFGYSVSPLYDKKDLLGVDVICGYGCCRNIASMLYDIFCLSGYENYCIDVKSSKQGTKFHGLYKVFSNHAMNMVIDGDKAHYFDPTLNLIYSYNGRKLINGEYEADRLCINRYVPFVKLFPSFDIDEDYKLYQDTSEMIVANVDSLEKFYCENMLDYMRVKNKCIDLSYGKSYM